MITNKLLIISALATLLTTSVFADNTSSPSDRLDRKGNRIDNRLDRKTYRLENSSATHEQQAALISLQ